MNVRDLILKITFVFLEDFGSLSVVSSSRFAVLSDGIGPCDPLSRESNFARPGASGGKKQPPENERGTGARGGEVSAATLTRSDERKGRSPCVRLGPLHDVGKNLGFGTSHHVHQAMSLETPPLLKLNLTILGSGPVKMLHSLVPLEKDKAKVASI